MKKKFLTFLKEKKDLLIFMGVLVLTFVSVITIASIATKKDDSSVGGIVDITTPTTSENDGTTNEKEPDGTNESTTQFSLPIKDSYVISREFFDLSLDESILVNAVMSNGTTFVESKGVSYSKEDNAIFDVLAIYPGTVEALIGEEDSLEGYTVIVKHSDNLTSKYHALSSVNVSVGDTVEQGDKLGVAGTSINDLGAGIHVHLEIIHNDEYLNPKEVIGKKMSELVSLIK